MSEGLSRIAAALDRPIGARALLVLFAAALAVRIVNVLLLAGDEAAFRFPDSGEYLAGARAWFENGSLSGYLGGALTLPTERTPGYFWFLSGVSSVFGPSLPAIAAVQAVIDAGTCVLIAFLAAPLGQAAARLAGLSAVLWPNLVIHASLVLQDTLFLFLLTAFLVVLTRFAARPRPATAAVAGFLFGAAFMVRAVIQFLPIVLVFVIAGLAWRRTRRSGTTILAPVLFVLCAAVILSPLLYRNVSAFRTLGPTTQTGLHALFWTVTLVRMDRDGTTFDAESVKTQARFKKRLEKLGVDEKKLNPFERDRLRRAMAMEELLATPLWRLAKVWVQGAAINLFSPSLLSDGRVRALPRPSFYATAGKNLPERAWKYFFGDPGWFQAIILVAFVGVVVVSVLQLWGLVVLFRRSRLAALGAVLFVGYFLAISGPTAAPKYRMPFEPVMIVLFALGLEAALRWRARASSRRRAPPTAAAPDDV